MKHFIVTRGTARLGHRADSLEQLKDRLEQHAQDNPSATPVSNICEGNLRDEWLGKKTFAQPKKAGGVS
jgi:hypothetical protein